MKLKTAFLFLLLPSLSAAESKPSPFIIEGKQVHFHGARVVEIEPGSAFAKKRRYENQMVPPSDREIRVSVTARDYPTLPGAIGGMRRVEIELPDGQIVQGRPEGNRWGGERPEVWDLASFPVVSWRDKQLLLRFEFGGQRYELPFANPGYREDVPEWQAQAFPVKWKQGQLEVSLDGQQFVWSKKNEPLGLGWRMKQEWSFWWKGRLANDAFHASSWMEDAGGNRSGSGVLLGASAWLLHCTVVRSASFPFEEDELHWFGWTKADRIKTIGAGECDLLEIDEFGREAGIVFAGLFGPGIYEFENGRLLSKEPPDPASPFKSGFEEATNKVRVVVDRPHFVTQAGRDKKPGWRVIHLDSEGKPAYLSGLGTFTAGETTVWCRDFPSKGGQSFHFGVAKFGEPIRFDLYAKPPAVWAK